MPYVNAPYRREPSWHVVYSLFSTLRARARLCAVVSGALFAVLAGMILTIPKQYESRMELSLGEREPSEILLANKGKVDSAAYVHDVLVNSEVELLRSADVLTTVVLKTGLQKLEFAEGGASGVTTALTLDKAWHRLQRNLKITPVEKSNILIVSYSAPTPELAQTVLRTLAASYPVRRIEVRSKPGTVAFLSRQSTVWRGVLTRAEADLIRCRRLHSGFVLPEERASFSKRALEAQTAAEQADAQTAEFEQKVYRQQKELEHDLSQARGSAKMRAIHARYEPNAVSSADLVALQRQLRGDRSELSGLESRRDRLKYIANRYRLDLVDLAGASIEHDALLRQVNESAENYLMYARKEEEIRLAEALARGEIADVTLADGPTLPVEPSESLVIEYLLLALLCSLACGAAGVLLVEYFTVGALRSHQTLRSFYNDLYALEVSRRLRL